MPRTPWFERKFSFDFPVENAPELVERFRGLPPRAEDRVRGLPPEVLTRSDGGWSIQENIGHLLDLEAVFNGRIEDFMAGLPTLRPADLTNRATNEGRHNERDIAEILRRLRRERAAAAATLDGLAERDFARTSVHPRLKMPMRLVDAVAFVCAHDDYHMARVGELIRKFK